MDKYLNLKVKKPTIIKNNILLGAFISAIYAVAYDYVFREFLIGVFGYMVSFSYHPMDHLTYSIYVIISVIPFFLYKGFKYISSIISFFCYLFVYIPFVEALFVAGYQVSLSVPYIIFFFVAQCVFFATDSWQIGKRYYGTNRVSFENYEITVYFLMAILILINFRKMHMVNIFSMDDREVLYGFRATNSSSSFFLNSYLLIWMNHVFLPILMVCYLKVKNYKRLAIAFVCMILVFMVDMQKISFLIPFIIIIFYYLYSINPQRYLNNFHLMLLIAFIVLPLLVLMYADTPTGFGIAALLIMRTQCIAGRELSYYFDIFELKDYPHTFFSHINIINNLTGLYPYDVPLGMVVSGGDSNSNATFFLMDGVAGAGLVGCIIIGALFVVFKAYFNTIGNNYDRALCVIIIFFSLSSLMNSSLFTSLITGGFLPFYIICRIVNLKALRNG